MTGPRLAGVELGGTKCVCTLASADGAIVAQETVPTGDDPEAALNRIAVILGRWHAENGFASLGIASFGPLADPAAKAVQPARVELVKVPREMTLEAFQAEFPSSAPLTSCATVTVAAAPALTPSVAA